APTAAPADLSELRPGEREATTWLSANPLRVLLAEDNRTNQMVFQKFLKDLPIEVTTVATGQDALEAYTTGHFDVIFMDINMPRMDGITATGHIRRAETAAGHEPTPIVALTANAMVDQIAQYLSAGMNAHLPKPLKKSRLLIELAEAAMTQRKSDKVAAG
ncbi:MAG: response regulator, partial [Pseudomonadota bacterium]